MTRYLIGFNCLLILTITVLGALMPASPLWFVVSKSPTIMIIRLVILASVLLYSFIPATRFNLSKNLIMALGLVLIYLGLAGLVPPDSLGLHNYFPQLLDIFLSVQGGIICLLCALELPATSNDELYAKLQNSFYLNINNLVGHKPAQHKLARPRGPRLALKAK